MADLRKWLPGLTVTAPSQPSSSMDADQATELLFAGHSVEEVRAIAQHTHHDIERKKEELRQLVGERYRDLIDAADSIVDMNSCSEHVLHSVSVMQSQCHRLQQTHLVRGSGGRQAPPTNGPAHSTAALMQLLLDAPGRIWTSLEECSFLVAAQHFLMAKHVFGLLQAMPHATPHATPPPAAALHRLWQSVACFRCSIVESCCWQLECVGQAEGAVVQSLCALALLECCPLRQVFAQFLLARKAAVQAVFLPPSQGHRSVKVQMCELVDVVRMSLEHIAAIFCQQEGQAHSLLLATLQRITQSEPKDHLHSLIPPELLTRLPSGVRDFSPSLPITLVEIPLADIHGACEEWIKTCAEDVTLGAGRLLEHVTSVKALATIRDAVHALLSAPCTGNETEPALVAVQWARVCKSVAGGNVSIWDTFLRPLVLQRVKSIVGSLFASAESHACSLLDQLLWGIRDDPARYAHSSLSLWHEELPSLGALGSRGCGHPAMLEALTLKARGCSPSVHSFCQSFGEKLQHIIEDSSHYLCPQGPPSPSKTPPCLFPFELDGDNTLLRDFLQHSTGESITQFVCSVAVRVERMEGELGSPQMQVGLGIDPVDGLLLAAHVCHSLAFCCPPLSKLTVGCHDYDTSSRVPGPRRHARKKEVEGVGNPILGQLQDQATAIYRVWAGWCARQCGSHLKQHLCAEAVLDSLASTLTWEEIKISEESEMGERVASTISVPAQPSIYVMSMLFALCQEISRIGGHAVNRTVLEGLGRAVLAGVLAVFEELVAPSDRSIPQACSLQLLFNLQFLCSVLSSPEEDKKEVEWKQRVLTERLQSFVDPFDLDVFLPHVRSNLARQLQRSTVLLGTLLTLKPSSTHISLHRPLPTATPTASLEKHIVIPLSHVVPRIPSLPISSPVQPLQTRRPNAPSSAEQSVWPSLMGTTAFFHHI